MSALSNITNVSLSGAAAVKDPTKPGDGKAKGFSRAMGLSVGNGLAPSSGIRSAQAAMIIQLKKVNQALNVVQALEGESSPLNDMLDKIESMIKQCSKNLVVGENSVEKKSLTDLIKDLMKGINAPVSASALESSDNKHMLVYIGKGFSVNIVEGGIVFDINKMFDDVYKSTKEKERQDEKREDYFMAMGLVKEALELLMESLVDGINKAGGLGSFIRDLKEATSLSKSMFDQILEESSLFAKTYGSVDPQTVKKLLN